MRPGFSDEKYVTRASRTKSASTWSRSKRFHMATQARTSRAPSKRPRASRASSGEPSDSAPHAGSLRETDAESVAGDAAPLGGALGAHPKRVHATRPSRFANGANAGNRVKRESTVRRV